MDIESIEEIIASIDHKENKKFQLKKLVSNSNDPKVNEKYLDHVLGFISKEEDGFKQAGRLCEQKGLEDKAIEYYTISTRGTGNIIKDIWHRIRGRIDKNNPSTFEKIGHINKRLGRNQEAVDAYLKAIGIYEKSSKDMSIAYNQNFIFTIASKVGLAGGESGISNLFKEYSSYRLHNHKEEFMKAIDLAEEVGLEEISIKLAEKFCRLGKYSDNRHDEIRLAERKGLYDIAIDYCILDCEFYDAERIAKKANKDEIYMKNIHKAHYKYTHKIVNDSINHKNNYMINDCLMETLVKQNTLSGTPKEEAIEEAFNILEKDNMYKTAEEALTNIASQERMQNMYHNAFNFYKKKGLFDQAINWGKKAGIDHKEINMLAYLSAEKTNITLSNLLN